MCLGHLRNSEKEAGVAEAVLDQEKMRAGKHSLVVTVRSLVFSEEQLKGCKHRSNDL